MTWLFSKAMMKECESLRCSRAQVAAYSVENCLDGEPSAQLNVMPTQHKFWRNDKTMECSKLSQFGLTCAVLTESRGAELLTLFLAAFHAKTLAPQEKAQELQASAAVCGKSSRVLLATLDRNTSLWKTAQCSLLEDLTQPYATLPSAGTMRNGMLYLRQTLAQTMSVKEFGLLPNNDTFFHPPNTTGLDGGSNSRKALKKRTAAWPTPTVNMVSGGANHNSPQVLAGKHGINLHGAVMKAMLPTPQASDNRDRGNLSSPCVQRRKRIGKQLSLSQSVSEVSGRLNPIFVEWLMGWPMQWTDLKPLVTDKCHSAPRPPLNCLEQGSLDMELAA